MTAPDRSTLAESPRPVAAGPPLVRAPLGGRGRRRRLAAAARHNAIGLVGLAIIGLVVLAAVAAPLLAPQDPTAQITRRLQPPGGGFLMGTDELGRDVFSRVVFGSRISLYVGMVSVSLALAIGVTVGLLAGYHGDAWIPSSCA